MTGRSDSRVRRLQSLVAAGLLMATLGTTALEAQVFLRGDVNSDGRVSGSDAHYMLSFLFRGHEPPECLRAGDTDGDGVINISDSIVILNHLVNGGPAPCAPFPEPGEDGRSEPPCDSYTVGPTLDDPGALLRVSNAIAGPGGRTILHVFATNSTEIAGYFATIRLEGARFGEATQVTDLSETLSGGFAAAQVFDGRMRVGFLSSIIAQNSIPPGDDQPVFQIEVCLEGGLAAGDYQIVVEDAELVDFETGRAILAETDGDVLAVPEALTDTGCASQPEPEVVNSVCRREPPSPPEPPGPPEPPDGPTLDFARGDVNLDGRVSIADTMSLRGFLFISGRPPPCLDAADADDSGRIDITDMIFILNHVFLGGAPPPPPFLERGPDPTFDSLGCGANEIIPPLDRREDIVSLGAVEAVRGQTLRVPVFLTNRVQIEAFQLVIESAPPVFRPFEIDTNVPGGFFAGGRLAESFHGVSPVPGEDGVFVVGFIPDLTRPGREVPPGEKRLLFSVVGEVALNAATDADVELILTDNQLGDAGSGFGDVLLRNELVSKGETRLPELVPGKIRIVGGVAILRGDTNRDGRVDLADAVVLLDHLFSGGEAPVCADEADANDDGQLNIADSIAILNTLFLGLPHIRPPFPESGVDPTEDELADCGAGPAGG